jgi:ribonuclease T1
MKRRIIAFCALLALMAPAGTTFARGPVAVGDIQLAALPWEAQATLALVKSGGPFPYARDNRVFGNRERLLPMRQRGYYREFTVKTPGARDRGARRIIAGSGAAGDVRGSGEYYYSDDHYNSFRRIRE